MDIDVVLKSHDCPYIVQCLGCFITESDVWICMELMATCFDKLLKRLRRAIPENVLGKVTFAVSNLEYKEGVVKTVTLYCITDNCFRRLKHYRT